MSTLTDKASKAVERNTRLSFVKVFTNLFWTGFLVVQVDDLAIVVTTARCLKNTQDKVDVLFIVCFYGENGPSRNYKATARFLNEENEIPLLSVKLELGLSYPKLLFASERE